MSRLSIWVSALRPKTLIASIAPILIGTSMAGRFDVWIFLTTLFTGVFIQVGTNLANDYFDCKKGADTKDRIGPTRVMASGLVTEREMKGALAVVFSMALLSCSYLIIKGGWVISALLALAILLAFGYTAGPIALAYLGLGDLFVIAFFGVVATGVTSYLQRGAWSSGPFIAGIAPGALSTAILTINNLRDRITDARSKKRTIPVRFGEIAGKVEYLLMILLASIVPFLLKSDYLTLIALIPALPLIISVFRAKDPMDYVPLFPRTAVVLMIYTLFFCIGRIL